MRILVATGTQKFKFNRLLMLMEDVARDEGFEIFAQTGNSDYEPTNYSFKPFLSEDEFKNMIENSDVVVTHGGVSTIILALKLSKRIVVVPRLAKYGEHIDNHQTQIADAFSAKNLVVTYHDGHRDIQESIRAALAMKTQEYESNRDGFISVITRFIESN